MDSSVERAVPLRLVPKLIVLGTQLKSKEKTQGRGCGKRASQRAQQTSRKSCSDDNYGNRSIFVFENIFIIKVLAYFKLFFLISNLQMYTKKIK